MKNLGLDSHVACLAKKRENRWLCTMDEKKVFIKVGW